MSDRKKVLLYLIYGEKEDYWREVKFSILSALRFLNEEPDHGIDIVLATDKLDYLTGWPVVSHPFDPDRLAEWAGPDNYLHRSKNRVMAEVMDRFKGTCIFIDTDTYFTQSPSRLFERVGPGHTVMHKPEGLILEAHKGIADYAVGRPLTDPEGGTYTISADSMMFNSGVVGLDYADRALLDRALWLVDELYGPTKVFNVEQYALGEVLRTRTDLQMSGDLLVHYWGSTRAFFHLSMENFFNDHKDLPLADLAGLCGTIRAEVPKNPISQRLWARLQRILGIWSEVYGAAYLAVRASVQQEGHRTGERASAAFRDYALFLLREERDNCARNFADGKIKSHRLENRLSHMLQGREWREVRDPEWLNRFPQEEQDRWDRFWGETKTLLERVREAQGRTT
ncbi:hypothetical protein SCOR_35270 [Sulfidibacter corallicola]|uniref:Nucleotide-diphospho-sugar transferase domain-containing protein n=1 Tax=Sulfidibacter corallicola TaxID=2818388 RepID=A0A8A4TK53_SULCO|nr:hypothetical protein [Sulfidibacter corallicola]QTD49208.1 hypothetical protein J3U87_26790 [Sulfidibacter corallicola]